MFKVSNISFGASSAVITSLAIIVGLSGMADSKVSITAALFILALADNVSDSFGIHMHQKSENVKDARKTTALNFITRMLIVLVFILFVLLLPMTYAVAASIALGLLIIIFISYLIAKERKTKPAIAIVKYVALAVAVILASFYLRDIINMVMLKWQS